MTATWLGSPVKKYDYGSDGGSWTRQPAIIVLHSTEGTGWTNYDGGSVAPHFTIDLRDGEIHQHISLAEAARALKNTSGGVETNRAGTIQIEIIGTCDPSRRGDSGWFYVPDMNATQQGHLKRLLDMIHDALPAIPLTTSVKFKQFDSSYGSGNGVRISNSSWGSYKGVCGHMHVPENSHGDPGDIPISDILSGTKPPPKKAATMYGIQQKGQSAKWISDGQTRRWIPATADWNKLVSAGCISNSPLLADTSVQLTACGGPVKVGTQLPPGYTPAQAGWVPWGEGDTEPEADPAYVEPAHPEREDGEPDDADDPAAEQPGTP